MKLIFEKSVPGRHCSLLPACDVPEVKLPASLQREVKPALPEMSETATIPSFASRCTASTAAFIPWAPAP